MIRHDCHQLVIRLTGYPSRMLHTCHVALWHFVKELQTLQENLKVARMQRIVPAVCDSGMKYRGLQKSTYHFTLFTGKTNNKVAHSGEMESKQCITYVLFHILSWRVWPSLPENPSIKSSAPGFLYTKQGKLNSGQSWEKTKDALICFFFIFSSDTNIDIWGLVLTNTDLIRKNSTELI